MARNSSLKTAAGRRGGHLIHYSATHMSRAKLAVACGLTALLISACGIQAKPEAGASLKQFRRSPGNHSLVSDPRIPQEKCLRRDKIKFRTYYAGGAQHLPAIQVGKRPQGPTMVFYATAGIAQGEQIQGKPASTGAEVIGSTLVYPNKAHGKVMTKVENCASIGVVG